MVHGKRMVETKARAPANGQEPQKLFFTVN